MANVHISIADEAVLCNFHQALSQAASVACDMIHVTTQVRDGVILKVVQTECQSAIALFKSISAGSVQ